MTCECPQSCRNYCDSNKRIDASQRADAQLFCMPFVMLMLQLPHYHIIHLCGVITNIVIHTHTRSQACAFIVRPRASQRTRGGSCETTRSAETQSQEDCCMQRNACGQHTRLRRRDSKFRRVKAMARRRAASRLCDENKEIKEPKEAKHTGPLGIVENT